MTVIQFGQGGLLLGPWPCPHCSNSAIKIYYPISYCNIFLIQEVNRKYNDLLLRECINIDVEEINYEGNSYTDWLEAKSEYESLVSEVEKRILWE